MNHTDIAFSAVALGCAALACSYDVRTRRIPNWLTGPAAAAALLVHLAWGGWASFGAAAVAGLVAGAVMLLFFLAGGMGAGDVKLMTAAACFTGLQPLGTLLLTTALAGAVCALAIAWRHGSLSQTFSNSIRLVRHHHNNGLVPDAEHNVRIGTGLRMPFALPIAAGCACTLLLQITVGGR